MAQDDPLVGRTIGEFVVREKLGEGGFGAVYRAEQPRLGREAVLKFLHASIGVDQDARQRFLREAQLASRFDHPFAAHVYDCRAEPDGTVWIAMELVHGTTLADALAEGPFAPARFLPLFERLCEVVQAAHEKGIVHRDIKPSNVMVVQSAGQLSPKLLDFGIARMQGEVPQEVLLAPPASDTTPSERDSTSTVSMWMTAVGGFIGSPPYMAPEQWADAAGTGPPADLYALGVLCYEALTGRRPFDGATNEELKRAHLEGPVPPVGAHLPSALDAFFARALAKKPEARFGSAGELAEALRAALVPPRRLTARAAALGAALLASGALLWVWSWQGRLPSGERRVAIAARNLSGADQAWLGRALEHLATRRLRDGDRRFSVESDPAAANAVAQIDYRLEGGGVQLLASVGRAGGRLHTLPAVAAGSLSAALDAVLPQIVARFDEGLPDRGPDPALLAEMKKRGTSSLEAFRLQKASFEGFYGANYADSERFAKMAERAVEKDPGWSRAYASLALIQGERSPAAKATLAKGLQNSERARDAEGIVLLESLALFAAGKPAEAFSLLLPIVQHDPSDLLAGRALTGIAYLANHVDVTIATLERMQQQRPDLQFGEDRAEYLRYAGRRGEVPAIISAWVERAPEAEQAQFSQASMDLAAGRVADAGLRVRRALLVHGEATFRLAPACDILLAADKVVEVKRLAAQMLSGNEFDQARGHKRLAVAAVLEGRFGAAYESLQAGWALGRTQGSEGESVPMLELIAALAPLVATPQDRQRYLDALAEGLTASGWKVNAAPAAYEAALARAPPGQCPNAEAILAAVPEGAQRTAARRAVLRLAADRGCASCAEATRVGISAGEDNTRSLFYFGVCAEREGSLKLAEDTFRGLRGLYGSRSAFHSVLARFHLGRVLDRQGQKDAARAEYRDFLAHWEHADVALPEIEEARRALAAP